MKHTAQTTTVISFLASILLVVGCFHLPIGYYTFLRIIVFVTSIVLIVLNWGKRLSVAIIITALLGILFNHSSISPQQNSLDNHRCTCCNMVYFSVIFLYSTKDNTTSKVKVMKKEIISYIITIIALIVIVPFELLFFWLPSLFKAFLRYISDKDKGSYTFTDYLDDVRHESKSFNKHWREAAAKGIRVD